jgi:hypothetical protein
MEARVGIGRLKRRFQTENTIFFRLIKHYSATTLPQHLHYTFADAFADSEIICFDRLLASRSRATASAATARPLWLCPG